MLKFSYGHILEAQAIALAKAAGHEVTGEQDELTVDGVKGHRDCVIDGYIVDVKSCSTPSFKKFKDRTLAMDDSFGYLDQLDGYLVGSADDDLVRHKDVAFDWAIDKTLGKMVLYEHKIRPSHIHERVRYYKSIVARDEPPNCECGTESDGESGNVKLDMRASYSAQKFCCFPYIRTFIYSGGAPRYFTRLVKVPYYKGQPLIEVDRYGKTVYTN